MTPGETAYTEDLRRCPLYHDGAKRKAWSELCDLYKHTWERNPTPRDFKTTKKGI